jgi:hypothetical protein
MVEVELPPQPVGKVPLPLLIGTAVNISAVHGLVGIGDRVTISGVDETCLQASQTTVDADGVATTPWIPTKT